MASAAEGDITPQTIKEKWSREQIALEKRIVVEDDLSFDPITFEGLKYIGGADISFVRDDSVNACAALVILSYPDLELVHCSCSMIKLTLPYIPGYLAFREGPFIKNEIDLLRKEKPGLMPQMLFLDGNGLLHSRGAGLACHVGVENDMPCIGVAKKLFCTKGIEKNEDHRRRIESLEGEGDSFPLVGTTGCVDW
ncbi:endonuclease V-like isoform X2 [Oscarella lobularis]|uniref:endonuclease V-like isoform X2 n=1 Tax=Oscarella lobularis TaxID=121494 RepID=UPI003313867D